MEPPSGEAPRPEPDREQALEEVVAACIEADSRGDHDAIVAILKEHPDLAEDARAQLDDLARAGLLEDQPREIGPYRILEPLGRGGMGAVYLAEQRSPVHRKVALKLVKRGMDTREVLARFAAERQVLALMNHPSIARVFDAGSTAEGRPYFVMEHVPGIPLTEYCDRKLLDTRARLDLLLQVCEGVQHAHLKGIVHRDLKPSNLLVAEQDGHPVVKIIDFGIAKATDLRLGDATLHTVRGVLLGTPEYMSPEQAGLDALDIDLRTDVYSLGVIGYELLSGELPFPSARLRTDPAGMVRILREEEPDSPSRRLATRRDDTDLRARRRGTTAIELVRSLRGDLDWICMKALEKDRERRYATVNELAADLRRHLANEPVLAGPPSRWYRLNKFVRRNRVPVAAFAMVMVALLGGLATSLWFYGRAVDEADAAAAARDRESIARANAETDFDAALLAVDTMLTRVADKRLFGVPRMDGVRRALLLEAEGFYRRFLSSHADDPRTRFQSASAKVVLSRVALTLGKTEESIASARDAITELERLVADSSEPLRIRRELVLARDSLGQALSENGQETDAVVAFRSAVEEQRALRAAAPNERPRSIELAATLIDLARSVRDVDPAESSANYEEVTRILDAMREPGRVDPEVERLTAIAGNGHAGTLLSIRDVEGAETCLTSVQESLAKLDLDNSLDLDLLETAVDVNRKLGIICYSSGRAEQAVAAGVAEVAATIRMVRDYPEVLAYRSSLASAYGNLAVFRSAIRLDDEARSAFRHAAEEFDRLSHEHPEVEDFRRSLATYAGNLSHALVLEGRRASLAEARHWAERALGTLRAGDTGSADPRRDQRIAVCLVHLADIARGEGRDAEARSAAEESLAIVDSARARNPGQPALDETLVSSALTVIALLLDGAVRTGVPPEGVGELLDRVRPIVESNFARTPDDPDVLTDRASFARFDGLCAVWRGDFDAARRIADDIASRFGKDRWITGLARAEILAGIASTADAETAFREVLRAAAVDLAQDPDQAELARERDRAQVGLAELLALRKDSAGALELLEPAITGLCAARDGLHVDADADESLARALVLRAELALAGGDREAALRSAGTLSAMFDQPHRWLTAATLLARAGDSERALELLTRCARNPPAGFTAALEDPAFAELHAQPRFAELQQRKR